LAYILRIIVSGIMKDIYIKSETHKGDLARPQRRSLLVPKEE